MVSEAHRNQRQRLSSGGAEPNSSSAVMHFGKTESEDECDHVPTWANDIQPYVQRKYEQAFTIYKNWQEKQIKEFTGYFDKKVE